MIDVWYADLGALGGWMEDFRALLSPDEADRAARFRTDALRDRCVLRRGLLRRLLGAAMERDPATLAFDYGPQGKPALPGGPAFNLADCKDHVLIAIGPAGRSPPDLGVDIERRRAVPDAEGIARRFFAPTERDRFFALPEDRREEAFLNGWTRKEAFIKATGDGLAMPLDRFAVELAPGRPVRVLSVDPSLNAGRAEDWSLFDLPVGYGPVGYGPVGDGLVAALAVRGAGWTPRLHRVEETLSPR